MSQTGRSGLGGVLFLVVLVFVCSSWWRVCESLGTQQVPPYSLSDASEAPFHGTSTAVLLSSSSDILCVFDRSGSAWCNYHHLLVAVDSPAVGAANSTNSTLAVSPDARNQTTLSNDTTLVNSTFSGHSFMSLHFINNPSGGSTPALTNATASYNTSSTNSTTPIATPIPIPIPLPISIPTPIAIAGMNCTLVAVPISPPAPVGITRVLHLVPGR